MTLHLLGHLVVVVCLVAIVVAEIDKAVRMRVIKRELRELRRLWDALEQKLP